ncbi:MAG: rhodanese-like domain-containing protein [Desulfobacteraceae bacterium]
MKKTVLLILIIFLLLPAQGKASDMAHPEFNRIKAKELKQLMDKKSEFILIDTRDSGKYSAGHIKGAANIHYDPSGDPNIRNMTLMALSMDKLIIVYCDCEDEKNAAALALELYDLGCDMDNLKILSGGIARWNEQGYPIITAGE